MGFTYSSPPMRIVGCRFVLRTVRPNGKSNSHPKSGFSTWMSRLIKLVNRRFCSVETIGRNGCALGMVSCSGPLLSPPYELTSMAPHPNRESALYGTHNGVICLGRLDGDPEHFCFGDRWGDAVSPAPHHSGRYVAAVFYDRGVVIYRFGKTLAGGNDRAAMEGLSNRIRTGIGPSRAALRQTNGSDTGALRDQTEVNVL